MGKVYKNVTLLAIKWLSTSSSWRVRKWKVTLESVLWGTECALSVKDIVGHCCFPERIREKHSHKSCCLRTLFPVCFHEGQLKADCICSHTSLSLGRSYTPWQCGDISLSFSFMLSVHVLPCGISPSSTRWQAFHCRPHLQFFTFSSLVFSSQCSPTLNSILLADAECFSLINSKCTIHPRRWENGTEHVYQGQ